MHDLIEEWFAYLEGTRNVSPNTIRAYRSDLRALTRFMAERWATNDPREMTLSRFVEYFSSLQATLSAASRSRHFTSTGSLFRWLHDAGKVTSNPIRLMGKPQVEQPLPKWLQPEEVEGLLSSAPGSALEDVRLRAILEVLYATGMRSGEMVMIRLEHIVLTSTPGLVRIMTKGRREQVRLLRSAARSALRTWIAARAQFLADRNWTGRDQGWLFIGFRDGRQLQAPPLRRSVKAAGVRAGIAMKVHPHLLRHTYATHLMQRGASLRDVQELLGHKSLNTTQRYAHVTQHHLIEVYRTAFPDP